MNKWWVILVLAVATTLVFLLLKYEVRPTPTTPIMKPSFFSQPQDIGAVVYRRFYAPIEERKLVVFGIPPQPVWHQAIVTGFLKAAAGEQRPFDYVLIDDQMPQLNLQDVPGIEEIPVAFNREPQAQLIELIRQLRADKKRVLFYTTSIFSTHLLNGNPLHRYEVATGEHLFSITSGPLALNPSQEFLVDPACVGSQRDERGTAELGCMILQSGRMHYRKQLPEDRYVSIMNSPRPEDYLLMTAAPHQGDSGK